MRKYIIASLLLLLGLTGCQDSPDYGDAVFITGTLSSQNIKFLVDGESTMALTVSASKKVDQDVKVKVAVDPSMLEDYNSKTGRSAVLPPEGSYSIEGDEVTISSGKNVSNQMKIVANSDKIEEGKSYCLPISITSVSGDGLEVKSSMKTAYIVFTKVINIKAANLNGGGSFDVPSFAGEDSPVRALSQMTLEMKIMPISFGGSNNISSLVGCEENFLFRFGDGAGNPSNKLQLAKASIGAATHPDKKDHYEAWAEKPFDTYQWHHFAAVYDGRYLRVYLDGEQIQFVETKNGGTINLSMAYDGHTWDDTFSIGRSVGHSRFFNGLVSECRVWNIARTQAQLQDGICYVDPTTPGLIAYWRLNGQLQEDGSVLDETGHGYNAQPWGNITWEDNQKCPF